MTLRPPPPQALRENDSNLELCSQRAYQPVLRARERHCQIYEGAESLLLVLLFLGN